MNFDYTDWDGQDTLLFEKFTDHAKKQVGRKAMGEKRIQKLRACISSINIITKKPMHESLKNLQSLKAAVLTIQNATDYSTESRKDYIKFLARMFYFLQAGDSSLANAPREIKEIADYQAKKSEKRAAKPVITREEIREIIKFGDTLDRALVFTLFESGMRIGEFTAMRKEDVEHTEEGANLFVRQGKTGQRYVLVVEAVKYLSDWLEKHPVRKNDAPLWVSVKTKEAFTDNGVRKRIRVLVQKMNDHRKKNGIPLFKKPINLHNFRHSRASELGGEPGMTEQILCKYFGWELNSDMPRTYLHLSDDQVRKAVLRTYGKVKPEEKKIITHRTCQRCKEENPIGLNYCGRCGADLESGKVVSVIARVEEQLVVVLADNKKMQRDIEELQGKRAKRTAKESKN